MIVVDTNVVAYLLIPSVNTPAAVELRRKDAVWYAPYLWRPELRNVLMLYIRRQIMTTEMAVLLMEEAEGLIESFSVDSGRVLKYAAASGCTAYDCEFVALAERLGVPLVTADKKLVAAFPETAISMEAFAS